ncbi:hypothetical protein [Mariniphaga sediminis]|uniref:hypothetical protein n=1 Tax=Mariniphaga sediminis TaxID=1628158 RepID=UPI003568BC3B
MVYKIIPPTGYNLFKIYGNEREKILNLKGKIILVIASAGLYDWSIVQGLTEAGGDLYYSLSEYKSG